MEYKLIKAYLYLCLFLTGVCVHMGLFFKLADKYDWEESFVMSTMIVPLFFPVTIPAMIIYKYYKEHNEK